MSDNIKSNATTIAIAKVDVVLDTSKLKPALNNALSNQLPFRINTSVAEQDMSRLRKRIVETGMSLREAINPIAITGGAFFGGAVREFLKSSSTESIRFKFALAGVKDGMARVGEIALKTKIFGKDSFQWVEKLGAWLKNVKSENIERLVKAFTALVTAMVGLRVATTGLKIFDKISDVSNSLSRMSAPAIATSAIGNTGSLLGTTTATASGVGLGVGLRGGDTSRRALMDSLKSSINESKKASLGTALGTPLGTALGTPLGTALGSSSISSRKSKLENMEKEITDRILKDIDKTITPLKNNIEKTTSIWDKIKNASSNIFSKLNRFHIGGSLLLGGSLGMSSSNPVVSEGSEAAAFVGGGVMAGGLYGGLVGSGIYAGRKAYQYSTGRGPWATTTEEERRVSEEEGKRIELFSRFSGYKSALTRGTESRMLRNVGRITPVNAEDIKANYSEASNRLGIARRGYDVLSSEYEKVSKTSEQGKMLKEMLNDMLSEMTRATEEMKSSMDWFVELEKMKEEVQKNADERKESLAKIDRDYEEELRKKREELGAFSQTGITDLPKMMSQVILDNIDRKKELSGLVEKRDDRYFEEMTRSNRELIEINKKIEEYSGTNKELLTRVTAVWEKLVGQTIPAY
jgi:hypothetical protein